MPVRVWSSTPSSVALLLPAKQGLDKFQIAHRDGVEHHAVGAIVEGGAVQVLEGGALRLAQVVEDGAGGANGGGRSARPQPSSESRWKCSRRVRSA